MIKLYKNTEDEILYWETWEQNWFTGIIHWGTIGHQGEVVKIKSGLFKSLKKLLQEEIDKRKAEGYREIDINDHDILIVEHSVKGMGTLKDLKKRYRIQRRMDQTLGWTGLGHCDGGSIGSGTMEVCCFVVNFDIAKEIVLNDLNDSEFSDFIRIYKSN